MKINDLDLPVPHRLALSLSLREAVILCHNAKISQQHHANSSPNRSSQDIQYHECSLITFAVPLMLMLPHLGSLWDVQQHSLNNKCLGISVTGGTLINQQSFLPL